MSLFQINVFSKHILFQYFSYQIRIYLYLFKTEKKTLESFFIRRYVRRKRDRRSRENFFSGIQHDFDTLFDK
jgi:hypothetical protein